MLFETLGKIKLIAEAELPADPFYRCVGVAQLPLRGVDQLHQEILLYGHAGFLLEFAGEVASGYIAGLRQFIDPQLCGQILIDPGNGTFYAFGMGGHIVPQETVLPVHLQNDGIQGADHLKSICTAGFSASFTKRFELRMGKINRGQMPYLSHKIKLAVIHQIEMKKQ